MHASLNLPYIVEDTDRKKPFTYDMEVAAVLCLAEAKRKKLGILGVSPERISYISKLCYPLWAVPWQNECLIADGLGFFSHNIVHMKPPDVKLFVEDVKRSTSVREQYRSALRSHDQTFKDFIASVQISIEALISNEKLLSTIFEYIKQGIISKENVKGPLVLLPPKLDEKVALKEAEKLIDHWRQIQSEIKGLQYAINVLNEETNFHDRKILREIEQTQEMYENEILRIKPIIEKRVERLMMERDAKIKKAIKATERELETALKEKDKHERKLQRLEQKRRDLQKKRETRKRRGDKSGVSRLNREISKCKDEISETKGKIQTLLQLIERAHKEGDVSIKKLTENSQAMINQERKRIMDLENSRDSEMARKQKEIEELRLEASSIISLIGQLIEQKRLQVSKLKDLTIPWRPEDITLICMPLYLVRYETETKSRYHVYAPMIAMGYEGIMRKIQKTIWSFSLESRIKLLLRPRRALMETLALVFAKRIRVDKAFEEILYDIGYSNSLLSIFNFREVLTRGLEELKNEGWVSSEEKDAILNAHAP